MADQDRHVIEEMLREAEAEEEQEQEVQHKQATHHRRWRQLSGWFRDRKLTWVICGVIVVLAGLAALPATRYALAGLVIHRDITLQVVDAQTSQPVSGAEVTVQGVIVKTDTNGTVAFHHLKPGKTSVTVAKKYYQTASSAILIGLRTTQVPPIAFAATGRQVPIRVTNKITGAGLAGVTITAANTEAQTNDQGEAILVVDATATTVAAKLDADSYNTAKVNITVSQQVTANSFTMTPAGSVYFLSKQSGTIDVVKTDLDGSNRSMVLAGTGNEEVNHTALLASHDWKFLVLLARRDGNRAALHLIGTSDNKQTQIDSNDATFQPIGWSGHNFVYSSRSNSVADWQPGQSQLKVFNADAGTLTVIDQTQASGTGYADYIAEQFSAVYLLKDTIVYAKNWQGANQKLLAQKKPGLYTGTVDKPDKKLLKSFDSSLLSVAQASPQQVYIQQTKADGSSQMFTYENNAVQPASNDAQRLFAAYHPFYITSPDNSKVLWSEPHGNQYSFYLGSTSDATKQDVFGMLQPYTPYGWYGQDYILLSKNQSELYIAPATGTIQAETLQKIADYHTVPAGLSGNGYGGM